MPKPVHIEVTNWVGTLFATLRLLWHILTMNERDDCNMSILLWHIMWSCIFEIGTKHFSWSVTTCQRFLEVEKNVRIQFQCSNVQRTISKHSSHVSGKTNRIHHQYRFSYDLVSTRTLFRRSEIRGRVPNTLQAGLATLSRASHTRTSTLFRWRMCLNIQNRRQFPCLMRRNV